VFEKCEKFLNIRREEVPVAAADAEALFQKLEKEHSQFGGSFLNKYISQLMNKISKIRDNVDFVDVESHKSDQDKNYDGVIYKIQEVAILTQEISLIISGIKSGLLVPGGGLKLTLAVEEYRKCRLD